MHNHVIPELYESENHVIPEIQHFEHSVFLKLLSMSDLFLNYILDNHVFPELHDMSIHVVLELYDDTIIYF